MNPVILITSNINILDQKPTYNIRKYYADIIHNLGAIPFISCGYGESISADMFDGLILSGGGDISPNFLPDLSNVTDYNLIRDHQEMELIDAFFSKGKPILGICRGMQILNVFFGGSLFEDINSELNINHQEVNHQVKVYEDTILHNIVGKDIITNSYHHQAVKVLGRGLKVSGICEQDGVVEAIEHKNNKIVGVQWHPERMVNGVCQDCSDNMIGLFKHFLDLCT